MFISGLKLNKDSDDSRRELFLSSDIERVWFDAYHVKGAESSNFEFTIVFETSYGTYTETSSLDCNNESNQNKETIEFYLSYIVESILNRDRCLKDNFIDEVVERLSSELND